ncbi:hypothetical protein [Persephonella sp.]
MELEERFYKALFKGQLNTATEILREGLGDYGEDFYSYYTLMKGLHSGLNPESYLNTAGLIKASLTAILKKAYRNRDIKMAKQIKELIRIINDFEVEDDIP